MSASYKHGTRIPYPHFVPWLKDEMRVTKASPNILIVFVYHPIYVIFLKRKPQLRCYFPIQAEDHSDQDPFPMLPLLLMID